jgi:transposase InsO family protein
VPAARSAARGRLIYRRRHPPAPRPARQRRPQPRALEPAERTQVLDVLHSEPFLDAAPPTVFATLLDQGIYLASVSTMYRILHSVDEVRERRRVASHPAYLKPELIAWRPNMIWSWDITKLLGPQKWTYYYLFVILDIFSRYVVGWMLAAEESAALAERLLAETICNQGVDRDQLTIHADRGSSMAVPLTPPQSSQRWVVGLASVPVPAPWFLLVRLKDLVCSPPNRQSPFDQYFGHGHHLQPSRDGPGFVIRMNRPIAATNHSPERDQAPCWRGPNDVPSADSNSRQGHCRRWGPWPVLPARP